MSDDQDRLNELEAEIERVEDEFHSWRETAYRTHRESAAQDRDDARHERAELLDRIDALEDQLATVKSVLNTAVGVEDPNSSTPEKRAIDLRLALCRQARDRTDATGGRAHAMDYRDVQAFFARNGHGQVSKPDCYKAMRWAVGEADEVPMDDHPAFSWSTKTSDEGNDVKAIRVDLDALPVETSSSSPTTSNSAPDHSEPTIRREHVTVD